MGAWISSAAPADDDDGCRGYGAGAPYDPETDNGGFDLLLARQLCALSSLAYGTQSSFDEPLFHVHDSTIVTTQYSDLSFYSHLLLSGHEPFTFPYALLGREYDHLGLDHGMVCGEKHRTLALVCERGDRVCVAFRGTADTTNIRDDLTASMSPLHDGQLWSQEGVKVHHGLLGATEELYGVLVAVLETLAATGKYTRLEVTGHSLGGASAAILALKLAVGHAGLFRDPTTLYTFGMPMTGNAAFVQAMHRHVPSSWRVVHDVDIIPVCPPHTLGFRATRPVVVVNDEGVWMDPEPASMRSPLSHLGKEVLLDHCLGTGYLRHIESHYARTHTAPETLEALRGAWREFLTVPGGGSEPTMVVSASGDRVETLTIDRPNEQALEGLPGMGADLTAAQLLAFARNDPNGPAGAAVMATVGHPLRCAKEAQRKLAESKEVTRQRRRAIDEPSFLLAAFALMGGEEGQEKRRRLAVLLEAFERADADCDGYLSRREQQQFRFSSQLTCRSEMVGFPDVVVQLMS